MKRGISALIANVLLVFISIAVVIVLWFGISSMINQNFDFSNYDFQLSIIRDQGYFRYDDTAKIVTLQIKSSGKKAPDFVQIILTLNDGTELISVHDAPRLNEAQKYFLNLSEMYTGINNPPVFVSIAPIFVLDGKNVLGRRIADVRLPIGSPNDPTNYYDRPILDPDSDYSSSGGNGEFTSSVDNEPEDLQSCVDSDADGYSVISPSCNSGNDCNDSDLEIHPEAIEVCNSIDDDCDGSIDESCIRIIYVNQCMELNESSTIYLLQNSVISSENCFTVTANNVTLDCQDWDNKIIYGNQQSYSSYYGVYSNRDNTLIKNCEIKRGSQSLTSQTRAGIFFYNNLNGIIENVNASINYYGIYLSGSSYNQLTDIIASSNKYYGVYLSDSNNNNLVNIIAKYSDNVGIYLSGSDNNLLNKCEASDNHDSIYSTGIGIQIDNYGAKNIINNSIANNNLVGFRIWSSNNNTIVNSIANKNTDGMSLDYFAYYNLYSNNSVDSNNRCGFTITGGLPNSGPYNNTIISCTTKNSSLAEFCVSYSAHDNVISNIDSRISRGIGLRLRKVNFNEFNNITLSDIAGNGIEILESNMNNKFSSIKIINLNSEKKDFESSVATSINGTLLKDFNINRYAFPSSSGIIIVENSLFGKISFINPIGGTGDNLIGELDSDIQIKENLVYVNSAKLSLNKTANITFYNLPTDYVRPVMLKDGILCPEGICTNYTSLNAGNVTIRVTGWSSYSIGESS